jgi:DNA-binding response OmpR family regulator
VNNSIKPKIILALDDERPSLDLFQAVFRGPTWKLICLQQEDQFHEMVAETQPDLILMDQNLTQRTGIELCEELRRYDHQTPVLFLSAEQESGREKAALQAGAQGYLRKPIAPCQLRQQVEKYLI